MNPELMIRLIAFLGILAFMAMWEVVAPRRELQTLRPQRWIANLAIVGINTIVLRLLFASGAIGTAILAHEKSWGVLNIVSLPSWLEILLAVVALDFVLYLQHVMFHAIPALWRLHMMHHSDLDVDVTTGVRFHPGEVALSMLIKLGAVVLIGASPTAVLMFEVLLNATSMFNHSNVRIPANLDRVLRWMIVTPDMHRIHHSTIPQETNRNFGFNLPWWDRLLGTYLKDPSQSHQTMHIGLAQFRNPSRLTLGGILALPFTGEPGNYPIGRDRTA